VPVHREHGSGDDSRASGRGDDPAASDRGTANADSGWVTFTLAHEHPGYPHHAHTFTASLGYSLTITVADPHPDPGSEASPDPGSEASPDARTNPETYAKANGYPGPDSESDPLRTGRSQRTLQDTTATPDTEAQESVT
jgi:hypothetical protein